MPPATILPHHGHSPVPRLVLVDGFTGAGKSTTAQRLWLDLVRAGHQARWLHEHDVDHPIFPYVDIQDLLRWTPDALEARVVTGWRRFLARRPAPGTHIIEGEFLQIPVGVMLALGAPPARIVALLHDLWALMATRRPVLVHLDQRPSRAALQRVADVRGPRWLHDLVAVVAATPYGHAHRVRTVAGVAQFYREQRAIIATAFADIAMPRLAVDLDRGTWEERLTQIRTGLHLPTPRSASVTRAHLWRHVGRFVGRPSGLEAIVTTDGGGLFLQMPATPAVPLLEVAPGQFCLESLPITLTGVYGADQQMMRFRYVSRMRGDHTVDAQWVRR